MSEAEAQREETAFHEAGHVVALYAQGFDLGAASIGADLDFVGRVASPIPEFLRDRLDILEYMGEGGEEYIKRQTIVALSGVKAIEILTGSVKDIDPDSETQLGGSDYSRLNLWLPLLGPPDEYEAILNDLQARTDRVLQQNWNAVRKVAEALLESEDMATEEVRSVLEEAGCARDYTPIRRVHLSVEMDRLRDRRLELMQEIQGVEERILAVESELASLPPEAQGESRV